MLDRTLLELFPIITNSMMDIKKRVQRRVFLEITPILGKIVEFLYDIGSFWEGISFKASNRIIIATNQLMKNPFGTVVLKASMIVKNRVGNVTL
jgi:hypothetical protein